ncbi:MAG: Uncharacterized protein G01um101413_501 [Parcubacteria group bacterium Gr01-1014_13]|nr:MAG: Uncharacterized protein G01um101413_501 [Parcubacteria group bacterium Gr01-1014_13]
MSKILKNYNTRILVVFLFCLSLALPTAGQAAEMFFISSNQKPVVGELFKADFFINTEEQNINAVAGKIIFSSDLLELKEIRDGNSIVNFWVDRPALKSKGEIAFSGITPGGYKGSNGLLFSLIFRSLKPGKINLNLVDGQALLNDGQGTAAKLSSPTFVLSVGANDGEKQEDFSITDKTPPESFVPEIARDNNIEGGKWFVVFVAQDKQSGIDHYEVQEDKNHKPGNRWQTATSPYILQDQSLQSYVYIKAVDKAGNLTIAIVSPKSASYNKLLIYGIILLIIVILGSLSQKLWRKRGD